MISKSQNKRIACVEDDGNAQERIEVLYTIARVLVDEYINHNGCIGMALPSYEYYCYPDTAEDCVRRLVDEGRLGEEYLEYYDYIIDEYDLSSNKGWDYVGRGVDYLMGFEKGY